MDRNLVRLACNHEVLSGEDQAKACGNSTNYKMASMLSYGFLGFFVILIMAMFVFTKPSGTSDNGRASGSTKLSTMGKFFILFGTFACIGLGYYMASEESVMRVYKEDEMEIKHMMDKHDMKRSLAVDKVIQDRQFERMRRKMYRRGYGVN